MVKTGVGPMGHEKLASRKLSGAHYTPEDLAEFVAKQIMACFASSNSQPIVLDPAVGDGELLLAMAKLLAGKPMLRGYDIDSAAVTAARQKIQETIPFPEPKLEQLDFLADSLTDADPDNLADIIIANPPYVRTQILGATESKRLSQKYGLSGKTDIYHAFIAKIAEVLRPGGIAGIIVSNRFMYTQSGRAVRTLILREFDIQHIWDFGDTKLFEASILPAVLILKKKSSHAEQAATTFTSIYTRNSGAHEARKVATIFDGLESDGHINIGATGYEVHTGILHIEDGQPWRISKQDKDAWLAAVASKTFCYFEHIAKVKVGIKTTADKVFIKDDWSEEGNPELVLPLITHHIARRFRADAPVKGVLYPYDMSGETPRPVELDHYQKSKAYLLRHKERLASRQYVIDAKRKWYEIWVPHKPAVWRLPKVVFRDISEKPIFWADFDGAVVNGDCYWMSLAGDKEKYIWLILAVANSSFIEKYYDYMFNNKLYSSRRRFITQYVNRFPLPDPESMLAVRAADLARRIYDNENNTQRREADELELDRLIWQIFGVS